MVAVLPVVAGPFAVAELLPAAVLRVVAEPFAVAEPQVVQASLAVGAWEDCLSLVPVELVQRVQLELQEQQVQRALWERRESTRRRCCHSGCLIACLRRRGSSKACRVAGR